MPDVKPHHILFLCVENSARSQMAEGLGRSLAPAGVRISSAGSRPTRLRPEAVLAMKEIGIDISHQRAKSLSEIETGSVDLVVTLCADQVCPLFPGSPSEVHWELPDPAAEQGDDGARMEAFRNVRDDLRRRIEILWGTPDQAATI